MTPMAVIRAATTGAAEPIGWKEKVGRIAPGYFADLIAIGDDLLLNIRTLENVPFVVRGGVLYKNALAADAVFRPE